MKKELHYREKQPFNKDMAIKSINEAIDNFIITISEANKIPANVFYGWKKIIQTNVKSMLEPYNDHLTKKVFNNTINMQDIIEIHKRFVITPVDKASNNIGIICKFFYLEKKSEEVDNSGNFEHISLDEATIVKHYTSLLKDKYTTGNIISSFFILDS